MNTGKYVFSQLLSIAKQSGKQKKSTYYNYVCLDDNEKIYR
jgi:hypothetical protein